MKKTGKVIKYVLIDVIRSRWLLVYTFFFLLISYSLFNLGGSSEKVVISIMNIVLFVIPLVSVIFGSMYFYQSREFIELLLSQPMSRKTLFTGLYLGLTIPLSLAFLVGIGIPFALFALNAASAIFVLLLLSGILLTFIFIALAFFISVAFEEKVKGFGLSILTWLFFAVIYDGIILVIAFVFKEYSLQKPMIALSMLNPIDLARILMLLKSDFSALMGYTGAVFKMFFGSRVGLLISTFFLLTWATTPYWLSMRLFNKKDF